MQEDSQFLADTKESCDRQEKDGCHHVGVDLDVRVDLDVLRPPSVSSLQPSGHQQACLLWKLHAEKRDHDKKA